jgi:hypothetical protein
MKPIGDTILTSPAGAANAAWRSRALQKTSGARGLHGEGRDTAQQRSPPHPKESLPQLHHNGTQEPVPFRDVPHPASLRLTAAFTAQLLGQILPDPERRPAVGAAYERPAMALSLGFYAKL